MTGRAAMKPKTKVQRGRTSLLTRALQTEICKLLQQGSSIKSSCFICGVGERTFYDWRDKGRRSEEPFARFFSAVTRAREEHKAKLIQRIVAAAKADWKAASWLLERQFVSEFGRSEPRTIVIDRPPPPVAPVEQPSGATCYWTTKGNEIPFTREQLEYIAQLRSQYPPASRSEKNGETQP
jgi:hypothetical protein